MKTLQSIVKNRNTNVAAITEDEALETLRDIEEFLIPEFLNILKIKESEFITKNGMRKSLITVFNFDEETKQLYYFLVSELNKLLESTLAPQVFLGQKENERLNTFLTSLGIINSQLLKNNIYEQ